MKAAQRRGVKFGRKVKLTAEQIDHARKLVDKGEARKYVADLPLDALQGAYRLIPKGLLFFYCPDDRSVRSFLI